jgi:hypothetical protein
MPCHHALAEALRAYIDAAGITEDRKGWLVPLCARPQSRYAVRPRDEPVRRRGARAEARQERASGAAADGQAVKVLGTRRCSGEGHHARKADRHLKGKPALSKRFDYLAERAAAADWPAVEAYEVKGINSYAKMLKQYRDRLLAAHAAVTASGAV